MPRLDGPDVETHTLPGNFSFTAARIAGLGATEYTLVDIEVDMSASVGSFIADLIPAIETAIDACRKSPRSDNLLIRVAAFSSRYPNGIMEVHGFTPLSDIDNSLYGKLTAGGSTPLLAACYTGIRAEAAYGKMLFDQEYLANGITFIITDGEENASGALSANMVKDEVAKAKHAEHLESHVSILIGVNASGCGPSLDRFRADLGIDQFIDIGDATKGKLAKLANFVSQSISSTSQALGTGGPSQAISATI